jgi:hypothetical protein
MAGDDLIPNAIATLTHAITIHGPRGDVWPWIAQMGAGSRAGWYSYDALDNGGRHSAECLVPELQNADVGTLFPAGPGVTDGFHVLQVARDRHLVLGWRPAPGAAPRVTWAFVLNEVDARTTRLVVRARGSADYPFYGLPPRIGLPLISAVHFVMQRKQLLELARRVESREEGRRDRLLDAVMPIYDVVERHRVQVAAPAAVVLTAASEADLQQSPVIRAIFKMRERVLGARPDERALPKGLLDQVKALGWRVLHEIPGREIVVGAVTQPWLANVVFRGLAPAEFTRFNDPGYVKIAWTLRADPLGSAGTVFRTETRVVATDPIARKKFRWYWARFSPGIVLIRRVMLRLLKHEAERRACLAGG